MDQTVEPVEMTLGMGSRLLVARRRLAGLVRRAGQLLLLSALCAAAGCAMHPSGPHGPACPIIEDASHIIEYPSERLRILSGVAARPNLSPHEQAYLVNAVMIVGFSSDKAKALITLIRNPCCVEETRQQIRKSMKFSRMLGKDEQRVVHELDKPSSASTQPAG
jgi:hypothetical protein